MLVSVQELVTYMDISFSLRQQDAAELVLAGLQSELETYLRRPIEVTEFTEEYKIPADHLASPMSSFFYQRNLESSFYGYSGNAMQSTMNYAMPPETIYLRNSPVSKVKSVLINNEWTTPAYLGEAVKKEGSISSASYSSGKITFTSSGHKLTPGLYLTTEGLLPSGYNIDKKKIIEVSSSTFSIAVDSDPGAFTSATSATYSATGTDYIVRRYGIDIANMVAGDTVTINYEAGLDGDSIPFFKLLILRAATREMQNMHDDVVGIKDLESRNVAPMETGFSERELLSVKKYRRNRVA
jgi:hypothetical protein